MTQILVVTDQTHFNLFLPLKEWGYQIELSHTLSELKDALNKGSFDIIFISLEITDIMLTLNFLKEINVSTPLIGLTTLSEKKFNQLWDKQKINPVDFKQIVYLPINRQDLIFTIEEILTRYPEEDISVGDEKPLTVKERETALRIRRRTIEDKRLSDFLKKNLTENNFD